MAKGTETADASVMASTRARVSASCAFERRFEKKKPAAMPVRVRKHIDALGFRSVSGYRHWCIDHGFKSSTDKSYEELAEESDAHGQDQKRHRSLSRIHDNPTELITQACASERRNSRMNRAERREGSPRHTRSDPRNPRPEEAGSITAPRELRFMCRRGS